MANRKRGGWNCFLKIYEQGEEWVYFICYPKRPNVSRNQFSSI